MECYVKFDATRSRVSAFFKDYNVLTLERLILDPSRPHISWDLSRAQSLTFGTCIENNY